MKVLFVCSGNAFRSPVAEALLKKHKPSIEADSAGTSPVVASKIATAAKAYLGREKAGKNLKIIPESIDEKVLERYDLIVTMEQRHRNIILEKCPRCLEKIIVWNIEDPYFLPPGSAERIFDLIGEKVQELAGSL